MTKYGSGDNRNELKYWSQRKDNVCLISKNGFEGHVDPDNRRITIFFFFLPLQALMWFEWSRSHQKLAVQSGTFRYLKKKNHTKNMS